MFEGLIIAWHVCLGLIIGSFLNVVIYRFNTGKSLRGRSHCLSCGHMLSPWHLVPVFSYVCLCARCAFCKSRISPRYFIVELLTGASFGFIAYMIADVLVRPLYLVFISVLVIIVVYDMLHMIIPDKLVMWLSGVVLAIAAYDFWQTSRIAYHFSFTPGLEVLFLRLVSAGIAFLFFASLWYVSRGRWIGFGDAKLAVPLGFLVSWPGVISTIILSFWIGAVLSLLLMSIQRVLGHVAKSGHYRLRFIKHSLTIKSEIPFAPFLIMGSLCVHFYAIDVFGIIGRGIDMIGLFN